MPSGPIAPRSLPARLAALPSWLLWLVAFAAVAIGHLTLLRLPYYWDEGGYYIPAALDFYHRGALIPHFTNAHPPLPNVLLGTLWHVAGFHILATRLFVCAVAAAALIAIFRLGQRLLDPAAGLALTLLTAVYPIWFAQSSLAHADIFAAAFTLWAFAIYIPSTQRRISEAAPMAACSSRAQQVSVAILFALAALSKETAILEPAALFVLEGARLLRERRSAELRREHLRWLVALAVPVFPLIGWYAYHHAKTGFTFGNPEYLKYNATENFTVAHVITALRYRFVHLAWQRNMWFPIVLAVACLLLPQRSRAEAAPLTRASRTTCIALIVANWIAFSVLGGALLTRYLLPVYPLILLLCIDLWREHTRHLVWITGATAAVFLSGLWINPPTAFAPEDALVYRDMIVVHEEAIAFVNQHYPEAKVLTAWPVSTDLFNPFLGYTNHSTKVMSIEDFSAAEIEKAAQHPEDFDTAIVFTTHYVPPALGHYMQSHPKSESARDYGAHLALTPAQIAAVLHGQIVWRDNRDGEWAAVLRFNRSYEARLRPAR